MANEVLKIRHSASERTPYAAYSTDQERQMAGNRRGEGLILPAYFNAVSEGRMYVANRGTASTPISFAKTAYDADQPQLVVDVPSGTSIMPIFLEIYLEDAAGTDTEMIWSVSDALIGAGTSTAVTPANARTQASGTQPSSACSVYRDYTGNGTAPSNGFEFARFGDAFAQEADARNRFVWSAHRAGWAPLIEGTGALVLHVAAATTAPAGFVTCVWWEIPTENV